MNKELIWRFGCTVIPCSPLLLSAELKCVPDSSTQFVALSLRKSEIWEDPSHHQSKSCLQPYCYHKVHHRSLRQADWFDRAAVEIKLVFHKLSQLFLLSAIFKVMSWNSVGACATLKLHFGWPWLVEVVEDVQHSASIRMYKVSPLRHFTLNVL